MNTGGSGRPGQLRRRVTQVIQDLPGSLPEIIWEGRRKVARASRQIHEARGDYSRSHPANHGMDLRLDARFGQRRDGFFV